MSRKRTDALIVASSSFVCAAVVAIAYGVLAPKVIAMWRVLETLSAWTSTST